MHSLTKAAAVAFAVCSLNPAVARAGSPVDAAYGLNCRFASVRDPLFLDDERRVAEMDGGPLVARSAGATVLLTCTIQVGAANSTHAGADACARQSATSVQTVVLAPTVCGAFGSPFAVPEGQPVYVCTQLMVDGVTYYWDGSLAGSPASWSVSAAAPCAEAITQEVVPGPLAPAFVVVRSLPVGPVSTVVDSVYGIVAPITVILCPVIGC